MGTVSPLVTASSCQHNATVPESFVEMKGLEEQATTPRPATSFGRPFQISRDPRVPPTPSTSRSGRRSSLQQWFGGSRAFLSPATVTARLPLGKCGCKKHGMDFHGDHTSTCTAHSGATKAHDWMVSALDPLLRTAGHTVRTQHGVTETARRRGDSPLPARPGWQPEPGLRPQHHQKNISNTLATH